MASLSLRNPAPPHRAHAASKAPAVNVDEIDVDAWWGSVGSKRGKAAAGEEDAALSKQDVERLIQTNGGM